MPQFNPQFQHQERAWNFYGAAQQMKRTARTNAVPAQPARRDGAMPADKPPLMPQKSLVTTANPTQSRTVQVPNPQYGIVSENGSAVAVPLSKRNKRHGPSGEGARLRRDVVRTKKAANALSEKLASANALMSELLAARCTELQVFVYFP